MYIERRERTNILDTSELRTFEHNFVRLSSKKRALQGGNSNNVSPRRE